jgi:murein DD-endopeptidase MepM/ murein hydrolase activator NlpD
LPPLATANRPFVVDPARFTAYNVQSGDTLAAVAAHFGAAPGEIRAAQPLPAQGLLPNGLLLAVPRPPEALPAARFLLPDSEIVNSPCGRAFNIQEYLNTAKGTLSSYTQTVDSSVLQGADIVKRVAENASVNPRFLLAFIEYRSHWVLGSPAAPDMAHPLGLNIPNQEGLLNELTIYADLLNIGYYGWRQGRMIELTYMDGGSARFAPDLNAGSAAVQYLFARISKKASWENELYGPAGFLATYQKMFGDPLACAQSIGPLFPDSIQPPTLELPFAPGEPWALTGGLHSNWNSGTPLGALDFAPVTGEPPCAVSRAWVRAVAAGVVTRSANGILQLALLDGAPKPTGWDLLYMHIAQKDRIAAGAQVAADDPLGHPSCEGGLATGTHIHLARMFRGEWIGAGEPFPFILSGWLAVPGEKAYQSTLVKGDQLVTAHIDGSSGSLIIRQPSQK